MTLSLIVHWHTDGSLLTTGIVLNNFVILTYYISFVQSDDNVNSAHGFDAYNSLWYVQTEAYRLNVTTDTVSV